jgi:hypothetical protein
MATRSVRCGFLDPRLPDAEVALPADVVKVGGRSSFAVVTFGDVELELNDSHRAFAPEFFATAGARVEDHLTLRSRHHVQIGRVGGRNGTGHCFAVEVGDRRLLGGSPPAVAVSTLLGWLADLTITPSRGGLHVQPHPGGWSASRAPHAVLVLALRSGQRVLLDVRPAYRKARTTTAKGLAVAGGRLSRVAPPEQPPYLTLDAPDHVVHLLTPTSDHLDEVADLGARLAVRALAS